MQEQETSSTATYQTVDGKALIGTIEKESFFLNAKLQRENKIDYNPYFLLLISAITFTASWFTNMSILILNSMMILVILKILFVTNEESFTMVKELGFEINTKSNFRHSRIFFPFEHVQHVFLNEVICGNRVLYLLTLMVKDDSNTEKLITPFKNLLPRVEFLQLVYEEIKAVTG